MAGCRCMFTDCIGPPMCATKQGRLVKVWGLLRKAHLCTHVLLEDASTKSGSAHVQQGRYQNMFRLHAKRWPGECNKRRLPYRGQVVWKHEKCLRSDRSLEILRSNHLHPIMDYPLNNQDVNFTKGVWGHFHKIFDASVPCSGRQCH